MEKEVLTAKYQSVSLNVTANRIDSYRRKDEIQNTVRVYDNGKIGIAGSLGELDENAHVIGVKILSCESEEDSVSVNFIALVNGEKQSFNITYNMNANELLDASCEIFEEKEGL